MNAYDMLREKDKPLEKVPIPPADTLYAAGLEDLILPYLPDPFASDLAVRILDREGHDLPGVSVPPIPLYSKASSWPEAQPFRIRLEEGDAIAVKFLESDRVLLVSLPKAEVVRLRLSFTLDDARLDQMGIWQWTVEKQPANLTALRDVARAGRSWMLTPWRDVMLVHAVQQPLGQPDFRSLDTLRSLYATWADVIFDTPIDPKSTQKLDLLATWNEPVDNPLDNEGPKNRLRNAHAFEHPVPIKEPLKRSGRHEFGDTRYRRISYKIEATTRFREYMPSDIVDHPELLKRFSSPRITYVQNSAPPEAPGVLYVLPTFGWEAGGPTRVRKGWGLRVYLERPWFSSGYGEMLAVVFAPPQSAANPYGAFDGALKPYVTQWGRDPIWDTGKVSGASPALAQFLRRKTAPETEASLPGKPSYIPADEWILPGPFKITGLPLAESGVEVEVAPHLVDYDPDRDLWYCDIDLPTQDSYYPFVRLALARYHPLSVLGAHLSRVVLADFCQLAPDRAVTVTLPPPESPPDPARDRKRNVTVTGGTYSKSGVAPRPRVEVEVQKYNPDIDTDLAWSTVSAKVDSFSTAPPLLWNGKVTLPEKPTPLARYRLVIKEFEKFHRDTPDLTGTEVVERVVYADIIEL